MTIDGCDPSAINGDRDILCKLISSRGEQRIFQECNIISDRS